MPDKKDDPDAFGAEPEMVGDHSEIVVDLGRWAGLISRTTHEVKARKAVDEYLIALSELHAETKLGAEALAWAMRADILNPEKELVQGDRAERTLRLREHFKTMANKAERSIWHRLFGDVEELAPGHLSDYEICLYYGRNNLSNLVEAKKAAVARQVGDYKAYLNGADIGDDQKVG